MDNNSRQGVLPRHDTAWREIDLSAIDANYRALRAAVGPHTKIFACLKQDAYGCGAEKVASALAAAGVDAFGVVSAADAYAVRKAAPGVPILMYPGIGPDAVDLVRKLDLTISISGEEELLGWLSTGARLKVFLKVDLGFWRAGVAPSGLWRLMDLCAAQPNIAVDGIYAHLSEFGDSGSSALAQVARLTPVVDRLTAEGHRRATVMVSSTESLLAHPELDMDAVDPGALLYGLARSRTGHRTLPTRPALSAIKARIIALKTCDDSMGAPPGLPGYHRGMRMAVLGIGWGHGLPRHPGPSASVLVGGRCAPVVPPLHLEHLRIDVTDIPEAVLGDEAVLLGSSGADRITLSKFAEAWGTDETGLSCGLREHLRRIDAAPQSKLNQEEGE
ncbi:alanine racemase [Rhizobium leguminosarum]|uniref:alanine racemase n=1 Tax=Rhizobium leguminosarum TaxID=384 RepID=UPI00102F8C3B|nr:alanine racemase [Rhizobium leguminosarum]TBF87921.1 alanine racemase [Rhizobium leguminosarum]TBG07098.1 alanine racemase [Rhizobium leguminosarum]TBG07571.1 alanine racemase [Rhizobium leguminosarum]TBG30782.1 alanine racemase [Rhizobium leguminosarum]TBG50023.1 alanine racemase [Rhizobium leguminosarum]